MILFILRHVFLIKQAYEFILIVAAMDAEKFQQIMDAIQPSKQEMQAELSSKLEKLQKEVTAGQESALQEVVQKIEKRSYQFRRKGNEE